MEEGHIEDAEEARRLIEATLHGDPSLEAVLSALRSFFESGGSQEGAIRALELVRVQHQSNEVIDSMLLEALDVATGWCRPERRIWKSSR